MERTASESTREDRPDQRRRDADAERDDGPVADRPALASLHRSVGNQAVQQLHEQGELQPKLAVSEPGDRSEREAERVADAVMSTSESGTGDAEAAEIQRDGRDSGATTVDGETERQLRSVRGGGSLLPESTQSFFEERFGRDFSDVRVHTGARADEAARSIDAEAFTMGTDIAFAEGNYQPGTRRGKELLAHELTHVVQQTGPAPVTEAGDGSNGVGGGERQDPRANTRSVSRRDGGPSGEYVQRFWPFTGGEESSSDESSGNDGQQQQKQEKVSPNDLSERTQRVLLNAGYGGSGKLPKPVVETAREVAELKRELGNDDDVAFFAICNALVASAYPTKTAANEWQIKFQGAVDDARQYSNALSVSKDMVRAVLEEVVDAPDSASIAIDAYNALHRSPQLKTVNEVKTGGPAGEEEREVVEDWEDDVLNYVLLDTEEKRLKYYAGKRKIQTKDRERTNKMLELANALREAGLGGGHTGPEARRPR